MDPRFTDWYRPATIDLATAPLEQRWKAVSNLAKGTTAADLPTVVLLAHGQDISSDALGLIHKHLHDADATIPASDNEVELRILAASSLMQILQPAHAFGLLAALYVESANFQQWPGAVADISNAAAATLQSLSRSQRVVSDPEPVGFALTADARAKLLETVKAQPAVAAQPPILQAMAAAVESLPLIDDKALAKGLDAVVRHSQRQYFALAEEVNILWWLYGERSSVTSASWRSVARPAAGLLAAFELNTLTAFPTPHPNAASFLAKVLSMTTGEDRVPLAAAINSTPSHWRQQLAADVPVASAHTRLMPICFAVARSTESPDDSSWVPTTEHVLSLKLSDPRDLVAVAEQFAMELLISRWIKANPVGTR